MNDPKMAGIRIYINTHALKNNYQTIQTLFPNTLHGAVVKANGYGIGADKVSKILEDAGCTAFFVARPAEALQLKNTLSKESRIYVFHGHEEEAFKSYQTHGFIPVLHSLETVQACLEFTKKTKRKLRVAFKLNTGMNRLGLDPEDLSQLDWERIRASLLIDSVHSHLACGRTAHHALNKQQSMLFEALCQSYFPTIQKGLSASCQLGLPSSYALDMTRQGLNLFGAYSPQNLPKNPLEFALKVQTKILQIRSLKAGATVGYDAQFTAPKDMKIATISMGYADGLPLSLSNKEFSFKVNTFEAPLIGQISMDLTSIDVTHIPDSVLTQNSWVDVFYDNMSLYKLAKAAQSSLHDIILGLGPRCERVFV